MRPRVPYREWVKIFTAYNRITAKAVKAVEREHPELFAGIVGRGNILRFAMAATVLKKLRKWALETPGVESDAEIVSKILEVAENTSDDEIRAALKEKCPDCTPAEIDNLVQAFHYVKQKIAEMAGSVTPAIAEPTAVVPA